MFKIRKTKESQTKYELKFRKLYQDESGKNVFIFDIVDMFDDWAGNAVYAESKSYDAKDKTYCSFEKGFSLFKSSFYEFDEKDEKYLLVKAQTFVESF